MLQCNKNGEERKFHRNLWFYFSYIIVCFCCCSFLDQDKRTMCDVIYWLCVCVEKKFSTANAVSEWWKKRTLSDDNKSHRIHMMDGWMHWSQHYKNKYSATHRIKKWAKKCGRKMNKLYYITKCRKVKREASQARKMGRKYGRGQWNTNNSSLPVVVLIAAVEHIQLW